MGEGKEEKEKKRGEGRGRVSSRGSRERGEREREGKDEWDRKREREGKDEWDWKREGEFIHQVLIQCPPTQVKQEAAEERKFLKGVKEKQDADMKQFLSQQKADYRGTKVIYKRVRNFPYMQLYLAKTVINT